MIPIDITPSERLAGVRLTREGWPVFHVERSFVLKRRTFPKCFIQLGRNGDLLIVLRALKKIHDWTGEKPSVIVSRDYAPTLEGVSYVNPIPIPKDWYGGIPEAKQMAQSMFPNQWAVLQCHGHNHGVDMALQPSFMESMWSRTGIPMSYLRTEPLVLDRRDLEREKAFIAKLRLTDRPLLLYNFTGISSPFRQTTRVLQVLNQFRSRFHLLDIGAARCHRVYDLLGLYEKASVLVTTDTSTLHLAWATPELRVLAFIVDTPPWTGSVPPPATVFECRYGQTMNRLTDFQLALRKLESWHQIKGRVYHVWSEYTPRDPEARRRTELAQRSWRNQPWVSLPIKDSDLPRLWTEKGRTYPYVRDLLDKACTGRADEEIIAFSNADIHMRSDVCLRLDAAMKHIDAVYCFRRDFHHRVEAPIPDHQFPTGFDYPGCDMYAFRARWWRKNREHFPDMLLATEAWDAVFRVLIDHTTGGGRCGVKDLIAHEKHGGADHWENPANRYTLESQKHNLRLAWKWFSDRRINPGQFGIKWI